MSRYPDSAGWKADGTSRDAAEATDAAGLRAKVLQAFRQAGPMTADQAAAVLQLDRLSVRPRCTELKALGKLADAGFRLPNASGRSATCWKAVA